MNKINFTAGLPKVTAKGDLGLAVGQSWLNADGFIVTIVDERSDGRFKCDLDGNINGTLNRSYSVNSQGTVGSFGGARNMAAFDLVERATRVYIAGPMTGYPDLNFPAFAAAAKEYRRRGCFVINPAELNVGADAAVATMSKVEYEAHWQKCMRADIAGLMTCEMIVMLDGWTKSKGATLEHHIAAQLGMTIAYPVDTFK